MTPNPFIRKRRPTEEMTIQITSMADIFTIILVFLLKSYSTSSIQISPSPGLQLPLAQAGEAQVEALKIEISENTVQVENQPISTLKRFRFPAQDLQANGSSISLGASLALQKKRQLLIAQSNSDVKADAKVLVLADQRTPYQTIKSVLASAATYGFTDVKLVVAKKE
jgi:biopolymer transport protein ExbD